MNPQLPVSGTTLGILRLAATTFSETKAIELAALLNANGTWQSPTLIREKTNERCDAPEFRDDPDLRYIATDTLQAWTRVAGRFAARPAEDRET